MPAFDDASLPVSETLALPRAEVWREAARLSDALHARLGQAPQAEPDEATLSRPLHEAVAAVAARLPEAIAATDGVRSVSYAALWQRAQAWAACIRAADPPPGPLALLLPADPFYAAGLLGCLMAGHACLPLDPGNPPARVRAILDAARLRTLVTLGPADPLVGSMQVIDLTDVPDLREGAFVPMAPGVDAPAFLVATSGSTGAPKLVVHSQRTITHRVWMRMRFAAITPQDRYHFGPGSITSIADIAHGFSALLAGASILHVDLPREGIRAFLDTVRQHRPTIIRCGSSLMRTLLSSPDAAAAMASVRMVRLSGEQLLRADVRQVRAVLPIGCAIATSYGSTEMAGHFNWSVLDDDATDPIRVPAAGVESARDIVILDEQGALCAPNQVGDIVVRSRYNAIGEWIDGACVPGRLPPDPGDPEQRVYASGDLGYRSPDGAMVVVGRADRQLKVNGVRVDPSEAEAALRRMPGVQDATVLVWRAGSAPRLIGFVVADRPGIDGRRLRDALRHEIPLALLPVRIEVRDAFPRLPNGKVDGVALLDGVSDKGI